jgi:hypothetical protein
MTAKRLFWILPLLAAFLFATNALAQHDHGDHGKKQDDAKVVARVGDAYSLSTCPITSKKLGSMGDPVVRLYDGREVRYCCGGCIKRFEKDLAASLSALDAKIIADQGPLYPLATYGGLRQESAGKAHEFVFGNRLVRVADEKEKAEFVKDPAKLRRGSCTRDSRRILDFPLDLVGNYKP